MLAGERSNDFSLLTSSETFNSLNVQDAHHGKEGTSGTEMPHRTERSDEKEGWLAAAELSAGNFLPASTENICSLLTRQYIAMIAEKPVGDTLKLGVPT